MSSLPIDSTRSGFVESVHAASVSVVDAEGTLVTEAGRPARATGALRFH